MTKSTTIIFILGFSLLFKLEKKVRLFNRTIVSLMKLLSIKHIFLVSN